MPAAMALVFRVAQGRGRVTIALLAHRAQSERMGPQARPAKFAPQANNRILARPRAKPVALACTLPTAASARSVIPASSQLLSRMRAPNVSTSILLTAADAYLAARQKGPTRRSGLRRACSAPTSGLHFTGLMACIALSARPDTSRTIGTALETTDALRALAAASLSSAGMVRSVPSVRRDPSQALIAQRASSASRSRAICTALAGTCAPSACPARSHSRTAQVAVRVLP